MSLVAGIDLGTQSLRVLLYDWAHKTVSSVTQSPIDIITGPNCCREQKTEWYRDALLKCFADIPVHERMEIAAIGVSGHQHSLIAMSNDVPVHNVKLWCDATTSNECSELTNAAGGEDAIIQEINNLMLPGYTAPKLLWLKKHHRQAFDSIEKIFLPHDYINYLLTGRYSMERGDASGTALFSPNTNAWSKRICDLIDPTLMSKLPPVIQNHQELFGTVTKSAAKELGIRAHIPVSVGGGDNMMSAIGTNATKPGVVSISLGTSGTLFTFSTKPVHDPKNGIAGFCSSNGGYLPLLCTMNCTVATESVRKLLKVDVKEFEHLASRSRPGANGIICLPFFNGERVPNLPRGKGCFLGINQSNMTPENLSRASMEAAIYGLKTGFNTLKTICPGLKELRVVGGGSNNKLWRSIIADCFNAVVKTPEIKEAPAFGAALQGLALLKLKPIEDIAEEHVKADQTQTTIPNPRNTQLYSQSFESYNSYLTSLYSQFC